MSVRYRSPVTLQGASARALQRLGLLLLTAVTVGLCYLALTMDTSPDSDVIRDDGLIGAPGASDQPSQPDQQSPSDKPSATGQPPAAGDLEAPEVRDQRLVDFTDGDDLPDGSVTYDSPNNASGMRFSSQGLTHGPVTRGEADGFGLVETKLESDVRSLGFRVRFAGDRTGSAVLVGWKSSAVAALEDGSEVLPSGMRLVATPDSWRLSIVSGGGEEVLSRGSFGATAGPLEFRVVRDDDQFYVVDPRGSVTTATKARAAALIGPFASWGLVEDGPGVTPAIIESVWAG